MIFSRDNIVLNNQYLSEYLKFEQQSIYSLQRESAQPHIYPCDMKQLKIPMPRLAKQTQIANHNNQTHTKAKQLQTEAKAELDNAKQRVEAIILGDRNG